MKVGLCLAYKTNNYGQILQAFATQHFIESLGYDTEILEYKREGLKHVRLSFGLLYNLYVNRKKNQGKKQPVLDELHRENLNQRKAASKKFRDEHFHGIVKCNGYDELAKKARECQSVVVGSDQNWLPSAVFGNYFTLRFVPDEVNKVSYATSLGVSEYPNYCKKSAAQFLKRLNYISVREAQGKKIISDLCDNPVQVVVDPTLLLTKEDWEAVLPAQRLLESKYVFCYFLGASEWQMNCAKAYAEAHNYKLVMVLSTENASDYAKQIADVLVMGAGPSDFVNYIRYAECVFTDSFHGTVFSVINEKRFYVFYRVREGSFTSRNSRIDGFLGRLGLESRLIDCAESTSNICDDEIDFERVSGVVRIERKDSIEFLKDALEGKTHEYK